MLRRPIIPTLLLLAVLLATAVFAHKDSAVSGTTDIEYNIGLGLVPVQVVAGEKQIFYLRVEKYGDFSPITDKRVHFIIYKDISASLDSSAQLYQRTVNETVGKYEAIEEEPGYYLAEHTFEAGNYIIEATLYEGRNVIAKQTRSIVAEPRGPSPYFWAMMLLAVLIAVIVARGGK